MSKEIEIQAICHLNLKSVPDYQGINSRVWRVKNYALKVYNVEDESVFFTDKSRLLLYRDITNSAARLAKLDKISVKLPFPLGEHNVEVNPYIEIRRCEKCGSYEALAPFVQGRNLDSFPYSLLHEELVSRFAALNYLFETKLKVDGIFIIPVNTKILKPSILNITDLCWDVADITRS